MKILITGVAGFIGSHLAEKLHNMGYDVIGLDNFSNYYDVSLKRRNTSDLDQLGIKILEYDLRNEEHVNLIPTDLDYVFHCAAQPGIAT
jgi:nucleoside-diphosphate-sugar epimerase